MTFSEFKSALSGFSYKCGPCGNKFDEWTKVFTSGNLQIIIPKGRNVKKAYVTWNGEVYANDFESYQDLYDYIIDSYVSRLD